MENVEFKGALIILSKINATPIRNPKKKNRNGCYKAYIVGGYCRDHFLNVAAHDIDIATSCPPDVLRDIFGSECEVVNSDTLTCRIKQELEFDRRKLSTKTPGDTKKIDELCTKYKRTSAASSYSYELLKSVNEKGETEFIVTLFKIVEYEVTTFRKDISTGDHRHPSEIKAVDSMKTDALRRDFTVNAIYMDHMMETYDYVGGIADVENKIIRTVGKPATRFNEDSLRMLRAFRFAIKCGFEIEDETYKAIKEKAPLIRDLSSFYIKAEIEKMIGMEEDKESHEENFKAMLPKIIDSGLFQSIPEFERALRYLNENYIDGTRTIHLYILMTYLAKKIPERFEFSKPRQKEIQAAINYINVLEERDLSIEKLREYSNKAMMRALHVAKILRINNYTEEDVMEVNSMVTIGSKKDMRINGKDIIENFDVEGPEVEILKDEAFEAILYDNLNNNKTDIIDYLKGIHMDKCKSNAEIEPIEDLDLDERKFVEEEYSTYRDSLGGDDDDE